jgi:hypothetical protein
MTHSMGVFKIMIEASSQPSYLPSSAALGCWARAACARLHLAQVEERSRVLCRRQHSNREAPRADPRRSRTYTSRVDTPASMELEALPGVEASTERTQRREAQRGEILHGYATKRVVWHRGARVQKDRGSPCRSGEVRSCAGIAAVTAAASSGNVT